MHSHEEIHEDSNRSVIKLFNTKCSLEYRTIERTHFQTQMGPFSVVCAAFVLGCFTISDCKCMSASDNESRVRPSTCGKVL